MSKPIVHYNLMSDPDFSKRVVDSLYADPDIGGCWIRNSDNRSVVLKWKVRGKEYWFGPRVCNDPMTRSDDDFKVLEADFRATMRPT